MIPITFMAGHKVWSVSRARWAAIYAPIAFMFVHISGQRDGGSSTVDWATTLSLFVFFGLISVFIGVAANVPDANARFFGQLFGARDHTLAHLAGQSRDI